MNEQSRSDAASRDRDDQGRPRNARPRDGLGRPLPYGAMDVPRAPGGTVRTPKEALAEGQRLLDAGMPFHAHEVLEDSWKSAEQDERQLWRGLAQLAVGLTHAARGNPAGAAALLARGAANMAPYGANAPHGIDVAGLTHWAADAVAQLGERPSDPVPVPRLRARSS